MVKFFTAAAFDRRENMDYHTKSPTVDKTLFPQGEDMYLDTHEQTELKTIVTVLHGDHTRRIINQLGNYSVLRMIFFFMVFMGGTFANLTLLFNNESVNLVLWIGLIVSMLLCELYRRWKTAQYMAENVDTWLQEIENLDTTGDDQEIFRELLSSIRYDNEKTLHYLLQEALKSPALSELKFIRSLEYYSLHKDMEE